MFQTQHHRGIFIILFMLMVTIIRTSTQDAETTEEPILTDVTTVPTATIVMPTATDTPSPTHTHTLLPSATHTPTLTLTMQPISTTVSSTISGTETAIPTYTPIIESTEELIPISTTTPDLPQPTVPSAISATSTEISSDIYTPTVSASISGTMTATATPQSPISGTPLSISPTVTSVSTTITPTVMPSISGTQIMVTITPTFQATATIGGLALQYITGIARYQSRVTHDAGILLQVYGDGLTLVSEVETNEDGIYNVAVPMEGAFWMVFTAEGYRTEHVYITEIDELADVILVAGDLNGDECINFDDIHLMQSQFNVTEALFDLNDDSETDISDLALLAGNLDADCMIDVEPTSTPEATVTLTPEVTESSMLPPTPLTSVSSTVPETVIVETTEEPNIEAETIEEP